MALQGLGGHGLSPMGGDNRVGMCPQGAGCVLGKGEAEVQVRPCPLNTGAVTSLRAHGVAVSEGVGTPGLGHGPVVWGRGDRAVSEGVGTPESERVPVMRGHRARDAFRWRGDTDTGMCPSGSGAPQSGCTPGARGHRCWDLSRWQGAAGLGRVPVAGGR